MAIWITIVEKVMSESFPPQCLYFRMFHLILPTNRAGIARCHFCFHCCPVFVGSIYPEALAGCAVDDVHWFVNGVGTGHVCARLCACWLAVHGVLHGVRPTL